MGTRRAGEGFAAGVRLMKKIIWVPRFRGDGSFNRPAGVALRWKTCAGCPGTVAAGDRASRLPCPGGRHVFHTRCAPDRVERAPVGNPLRCPVEACGAWPSKGLVLIDVGRTDSDVWDRVQDLGSPPVDDASVTPPDGFPPWTADSRDIRESLNQYSVADFCPRFD